MPEGPEAHVMADDLAGLLLAPRRRLIRVDFPSASARFSPAATRAELLVNRRPFLRDVCAVGKKVVFCFGDSSGGAGALFLVCSLGMSGIWLARRGSATRAELVFEAGDGSRCEAFFDDLLGWGSAKFCRDLDEGLARVGPDVLNGEATPEAWSRALRRDLPVCSALLDQTRVSGIGNYLRADILFRAGVDPRKKGSELSEKQLSTLLQIAREVMEGSLAVGGHTLEHYFRVDGSAGGYQPLVYARRQCPLGHPTSVFLDVPPGESSRRKCYFCPVCQR